MSRFTRVLYVTAGLLLVGCAHHAAETGAAAAHPPGAPAQPTPPSSPQAEPTPPPERRVSAGGGSFTTPCYPADQPMSDAADNPKFGDYVYVQELPEAIEKVPPVYPESARSRGITGSVMVQAQVRRDGTVGDVCIVKSIPALDAAAAACVKRWRFKPAKVEGNPVAVWVGVPVHFELH